MPNLTVYLPSQQMPTAACLTALSRECTQLCTSTLGAALENVHILYVGVHQGQGQPAYAALQYRQNPHRSPAVMAQFMQQLEATIERHTGFLARIRCFAYADAAIAARN